MRPVSRDERGCLGSVDGARGYATGPPRPRPKDRWWIFGQRRAPPGWEAGSGSRCASPLPGSARPSAVPRGGPCRQCLATPGRQVRGRRYMSACPDARKISRQRETVRPVGRIQQDRRGRPGRPPSRTQAPPPRGGGRPPRRQGRKCRRAASIRLSPRAQGRSGDSWDPARAASPCPQPSLGPARARAAPGREGAPELRETAFGSFVGSGGAHGIGRRTLPFEPFSVGARQCGCVL
jgi:hypothetical protein